MTRDLYPLASYFFRKYGHWQAKGKNINRMLVHHDAIMTNRFENAFADLFANGTNTSVIAVAVYVVHANGGWLAV